MDNRLMIPCPTTTPFEKEGNEQEYELLVRGPKRHWYLERYVRDTLVAWSRLTDAEHDSAEERFLSEYGYRERIAALAIQ